MRAGALLALALLAAAPPPPDPDETRLREALRSIDEIAKLYKSEALRFTADETIDVRRGSATELHRFRHIYVVDASGHHDERRFPVTRGDDPKAVGTTTAYNWIFLFEAERRAYVRYAWLGEERRLGRRAIGVSFAPRDAIYPEVNDWYGNAWFDAETFRPLVVEAWDPHEYGERQELERRLAAAAQEGGRSRSRHVVTSVRAVFGEKQNGLRLPTRVSLREVRYTVWGKKGTSGFRETELASVVQRYENYRFYGVETEERMFGPGERPRE